MITVSKELRLNLIKKGADTVSTVWNLGWIGNASVALNADSGTTAMHDALAILNTAPLLDARPLTLNGPVLNEAGLLHLVGGQVVAQGTDTMTTATIYGYFAYLNDAPYEGWFAERFPVPIGIHSSLDRMTVVPEVVFTVPTGTGVVDV